MKAKIGDWVQIHQIVLKPEKRFAQLPEDTKKVSLELWVKGFALTEAEVGETIKIKTMTGREVEGELVDVNPSYIHNFGNCVPELNAIDKQLVEIMRGGL
jgi:hypothetical protein